MSIEQNQVVRLQVVGGEPAVIHAGEVLVSTLAAMLPGATVTMEAQPPGFERLDQALVVGVAADLSELIDPALLEVDPLDDVVAVDVAGERGVITGSNPRAVLFAACRYLEQLGCRWLRPGRDGYRIPTLDSLPAERITLRHTPTCRHRCICIEGSTSIEHAIDLVDYAARRGFNSYFIQFRNALTFFDRWYGQESRPGLERIRLSSDEAMAYRDQLKAAALQRGMTLHVVGHGWTCEPFGIKGEEWARSEEPIPEEARPFLALINDQRDLHGGIALNTNLDLSNPEARRIMAEAVVDYAATHTDEAVIHVWLADGVNNHDESDRARAKLPSDWYVMLLNEIDARLTGAGLDARIVFLAYVDLLWAPQEERLHNPDRFILMFAPITRGYTRSFLEASREAQADDAPIPPFQLNHNEFPSDPAVNLRMLDGWRRIFPGEAVDFDYHLWWNQHYDPTHMSIARVLFEDCRDMKALGMDGFISCQLQRVAFPTGLAMHVMGEALWDHRATFDALTDAYFHDVFGEAGGEVRAYLEGLATLLDQPALRGEREPGPERDAAIAGLEAVPEALEAFSASIEQGRADPDPVTAASFAILQEHAWYVAAFARIYALALRRDDQAVVAYEALAAGLADRLPAIHHVFDTWIALGRTHNSLAVEGLVKPTPR